MRSPRSNAAEVGRTIGRHESDFDAGFTANLGVRECHAQETILDFFTLAKNSDNALEVFVGGNGVTGAELAIVVDDGRRGREADQFAIEVEECPARDARIHFRVVLQKRAMFVVARLLFERRILFAVRSTSAVADVRDAAERGTRFVESEARRIRVRHQDHELAGEHRRAIEAAIARADLGELDGRHLLGRLDESENGEVGARIGRENVRVRSDSAGKEDVNLRRAFNRVKRREDEPRRIDDHAAREAVIGDRLEDPRGRAS